MYSKSYLKLFTLSHICNPLKIIILHRKNYTNFVIYKEHVLFHLIHSILFQLKHKSLTDGSSVLPFLELDCVAIDSVCFLYWGPHFWLATSIAHCASFSNSIWSRPFFRIFLTFSNLISKLLLSLLTSSSLSKVSKFSSDLKQFKASKCSLSWYITIMSINISESNEWSFINFIIKGTPKLRDKFKACTA